jgi:hypothetical protein
MDSSWKADPAGRIKSRRALKGQGEDTTDSDSNRAFMEAIMGQGPPHVKPCVDAQILA